MAGREREGSAGRAWTGRTWAAPIAAAAGVAAALAVVFALTTVIHPGRPGSGQPGGLAALPRYYVALNYAGNGQCCTGAGKLFSPRTQGVVRATLTGRALARIDPPRPYGTFAGVTAAGDDRTFVLAAEKLTRYPVQEPDLPQTKFFILRLDPASRNPAGRARLTPLPIPAIRAGNSATEVVDFALSPDGTRLAVLSTNIVTSKLSVFDVATGAGRSWQVAGVSPARVGVTQVVLSWAADNRTLAVVLDGLRLLDTDQPGSGLLADSRLVLRPTGADFWDQAQLTPDGHAIIVASHNPAGKTFSQRLLRFSVPTGKAVRVLRSTTSRHGRDEVTYGSYERVHWMSPSGDVLIVTDSQPGVPSRAPFAAVNAGMLTGGHYTPLPWSENIFTAAW